MHAKINGVQLGYDDFGQGPVVLFLHDYLLNRQMWKPQVEPLVADGFRVILVDLRGFGESELGKDPVSIPTYSTDIIGLLDYLGIGRAVICGLSFGASVLFDLMENYPERIVGACLAASRAVADDSHERARRGELMAALERGELPRVKDELTHMLLGHREEALAEKQRTEVRRTIQALQEETLGAALQALGRRKDYTFLLKHLDLPTLLIGAERDPISHPGHTDLIASQLPNCYRAVKLSSGHLMNLENSAEFNLHLRDFLTALAPRKKGVMALPLSSAV